MRKDAKDLNKTSSQMTWEATQNMVRQILEDPIVHLWDTPASGGVAPHVAARDREVFQASIATPKGAVWHPSPERSLIECWASPAPKDWFSFIKKGLDSIETAPQSIRASLQAMANPLREALDSLSAQLQPAPAMRGAAALDRLELPKRSRRVHAADLPAFSPLFCTSLLPSVESTPISGLRPYGTYRCRFRCPQVSDWSYECELTSSDTGEVAFPIAEAFRTELQDSEPMELVWLFEETGSFRSGMSAWISGLIWPRKSHSQQSTSGIRALFDAPQDNLSSEKVKTLLAINQLIAEERYIEAYETTRRALLFAPKPEAVAQPVPFQEVLWQLIETILRAMQSRLRSAEPIFRSLRPEWNAAASLDEVIHQIQPQS